MRKIPFEKVLRRIAAAGVILVGVLIGATRLNHGDLPSVWLLHISFFGGVLAAAWLLTPHRVGKTHWILTWSGMILSGLGIIIVLIYSLTSATEAAWTTTIFVFAVFLGLDEVISDSFESIRPVFPKHGYGRAASIKSLLTRWFVHIILALACGGLIAIIAQIESHFADEEFFVALQALGLAAYWLVLRGVKVWLFTRFPQTLISETEMVEKYDRKGKQKGGITLDSRWLVITCMVTATTFLIISIKLYQGSFFPTEAPTFPGISAENPFLCNQVPPDSQTYDSQDIFRRLLGLVEANPYKASPEYGMLALGSGEPRWAQAFHDNLLDEARQGLFTDPTGSVKSVQFNAALRIYYYSRIRAAIPGLFTYSEDESIRKWFTAINLRALTIEPVDWLYAMAFSKWPAGPYENQESGAGLLSLLETTGLTDPMFSIRNRAYLDKNQRGWMTRFRVTDDAAIYQPEWIDNAYFQSLFTSEAPLKNIQRSFEWLLFQALPDGSPLKYNHPGLVSLDGIAYFGEKLTGNDNFLWLAGRTVEYLESQGMYAEAQPGLETRADHLGHSPVQGTCLLYGDSGLPNQIGPLAPDKIVFRDGWSTDSAYLLINLRFSGWHRYKASNDIVLVYQDGPLAIEKLSGEIFSWLPIGRSLFRDKRIPRENLNGLVIARSGLSAAVSGLTGIGGAWAQDPPYYAAVENFSPGTEMDTSTTVLSDWRGWTQHRTIYFYHGGPIVVMDDAQGPESSPAALVWHFPEGTGVQDPRFQVRSGDHPAEVVLIPIAGTIHPKDDDPGLQVQVQNTGHLSLVTVFLTGEWVGAKVYIQENTLVMYGPRQIELSIP